LAEVELVGEPGGDDGVGGDALLETEISFEPGGQRLVVQEPDAVTLAGPAGLRAAVRTIGGNRRS